MTATKFICPNNDQVLISQCLERCPHCVRCMAKPTLNAVANSVKDRKLGKSFSVTELISGTREIFLKKTADYAIKPNDQLFALHGTAIHSVSEANSDSRVLTEFRLSDDLCSGQIDAYGDLLGNGKRILLDYKCTSSYKAMRALGLYKVDVPTGETYKTGAKKGQPKTRKEWRSDGVRHLLEWAIQVNYYRYLLEQHSFPVDEMYIQIYVRDYSVRMASERNIDRPIYLLKINKISDHWLRKYFKAKKNRLEEALKTGVVPDFCSTRENWNGRKCESYCDVYEQCKHIHEAKEEPAA